MLKVGYITACLLGVFWIGGALAKDVQCSVNVRNSIKDYDYQYEFTVSGVNDTKEFAKKGNLQIFNAKGAPIFAENIKVYAYPGETFSSNFNTSIQYVKFSKGPTENQRKAIGVLTPAKPTDAQKKAIELLAKIKPSKDEKDKKFIKIVEDAREKMRGFTCKIHAFTRG
jgi:hypothetical protein